MTVLHDEDEGRFARIETLWAFISVGDDGSEGVLAASREGLVTPLIGADEKRVRSMRPVAEQIAGMTDKEVWLVKFTGRVDQELIKTAKPSRSN